MNSIIDYDNDRDDNHDDEYDDEGALDNDDNTHWYFKMRTRPVFECWLTALETTARRPRNGHPT